jgi:glycosyltransferase involved in cell wall biosynthesis
MTDVNFTTPAAAPATPGLLCLNMIVKNESKIIERLLASVLSIVDCYCICDTGSTDDTADKIRAFMAAAGKPGEVYSEPFKNFGYNRTHALDRAARWGRYALLLDADMRLQVGSFRPAELLAATTTATGTGVGGYSILQCAGSMEYYNLRIARTGVGIRCVGPTHEYYDIPAGHAQTRLAKDVLHIQDIGDGGCKSDKFERDVRLLTEGLLEEPANARHHFYLANSHRDLGNHAEAVEWYKKRVALGGWVEEVFYAAYECGNMHARLGNTQDALYWWMEAYNRHPARAESIYEITKYYRESGKHAAAQVYCSLGLRIPYPKDDVLFIKTSVYEYLFHYEQSILSYYTRAPLDHYKYLDLIGCGHAHTNVLSNYQFYIRPLSTMEGVRIHTFDDTWTTAVNGCSEPLEFVSSTPSIFHLGGGGDTYGLCVRYVNYHIEPNGAYTLRNGDGKIPSLYKYKVLNKRFEVLETHDFDTVQDPSLKYQGIEDVKVMPHRGRLLFLGTVQPPGGDPNPVRLTLGVGEFDRGKRVLECRPFVSPAGRAVEKNWACAHDARGELRVVYEWSPLTVGVPRPDGTLDILHRHTAGVPGFFRDVRGSSHGYTVGEEVWFVCHIVHYASPRHYYHILVVLNAADLSYKKHSIPFKFEAAGGPIEYCLGLIVEPDRCLMSFSSMDRTSRILEVPRSVVATALFPPRDTGLP